MLCIHLHLNTSLTKRRSRRNLRTLTQNSTLSDIEGQRREIFSYLLSCFKIFSLAFCRQANAEVLSKFLSLLHNCHAALPI
jgi:hypothetical protein